MNLKIEIKSDIVSIELVSGRKIIDKIDFQDINNLSEQLLPVIDCLLRKNEIAIADIKKIDSDIDIPESYTASRIAKATVKGLTLRLS